MNTSARLAFRQTFVRATRMVTSHARQGARASSTLTFHVGRNRFAGTFARATALSLAIGSAYGTVAFLEEANVNTHTDPSSQIKFDKTLTVDPRYNVGPMNLLGTGVRYKYGWVQVGWCSII